MPIHASFKNMARSMVNNPKYCARNPKKVTRKFTDGTSIRGCQGGWSVFYATIRKRGIDETKPISHHMLQELMDSIAIEAIIPKVFGTKKNTEEATLDELIILHAYSHANKMYDIHIKVKEELENRGYPHFDIDEVDSYIEEPLGEYVTLEEVLKSFPSSVAIKGEPWEAYISGDIVNKGKTSKIRGIDLIFKREVDPRVIYAIKSIEPSWLSNMINVIFDPNGIYKGDNIPLFQHGLFKTSKQEQSIEEPKIFEIKPFMKFDVLKTKTGNKNEFSNYNTFYKVWASKYLDRGIIIQNDYKGKRFTIHKEGDKIGIFCEDERDISSLIPNVINELMGIDHNFILDSEMVLYNCNKKIVKSAKMKSSICEELHKDILEKISPEQENCMVFHVHDILYLDGESLNNKGYYERWNKIPDVIPENSRFLHYVRSSCACESPNLLTSNVTELYKISKNMIAKVADSKYPIKIANNKTEEWSKLTNIKFIESLQLETCPYYRESWCNLSKENIEFPISCDLANIFKCHYLKGYYYEGQSSNRGEDYEDN